MQWDIIISFTVVVFILAISEMVSIRSQAKIPSVFTAAVIFLIGFWWFFPKNVMAPFFWTGPISV
jgi:hypothetical protein